MYTVVSTRFNNETWEENKQNRERRNIGCLYGSPQEMSPKIDLNSPVFVVEMNNSINKIEGIGLIKNKPDVEKHYRMYVEHNFNRYVYIGNYHVSRELLIEYNEPLVDALDYILFKEKTHSKRGAGFTTIPEKLLKKKICENINIKKDIREIFLYHFKSRINHNQSQELISNT